MKRLVISSFAVILLSACTSVQKAASSDVQPYSYFQYKVTSTGHTMKVGYIRMTEDYARKLLRDFERSGGYHKDVVESASKYKSHSLSLRVECSDVCKYVVDSFVPCSGATEYYLRLNDKSSDVKFDFFSEMQTMDECCFGPRRSWLSRLINP